MEAIKKTNSWGANILIAAIIVIAIIFFATVSKSNESKQDLITNPTVKEEPGYVQRMIVPIREIMTKTPEQVQQYLGKPYKIITGSKVDCASPRLYHCIEIHYKKDSITVMYTEWNRLSYWIEFDHLQDYKFINLTDILGLEPGTPTATDIDFVWYQNYTDFKNISFLPLKSDRTKLDYIIAESDFRNVPMNSFRK